MASSFVEFHGNGFWTHDIDLIIWSYYVAQVIDSDIQFEELRIYSRESLLPIYKGASTGAVNFSLNELTQEHISLLIDVIHQTIRLIQTNHQLLSASILQKNLDISGVTFLKDQEFEHFRLLGKAFAQLLENKWKFKASDKEALNWRELID